MQQIVLSKQSLILTFLSAFYKRNKQIDSFVQQGKQLFQSIIDNCYERSLLQQRLSVKQDQLQKQYIEFTINAITGKIQQNIIKVSDVVNRYIQQIQEIEKLSRNVNQFLKMIKDPSQILRQETSEPKLDYIQSLLQLLVLIKQHCSDYTAYVDRVHKLLNVFQDIGVNGNVPQQNTLKYYLLIWIHQPLLKDITMFSDKYSNLQKLKMLIR